jgi:microcin C transport system substrate-binding protein
MMGSEQSTGPYPDADALRFRSRPIFACISPGLAQDGEWRHATGLTGEPKYPAGFAHFDYVNPNAPKGGLVRFGTQGGFDSFNPILDTMGNVAPGLGYLYDTLMTSSYDELNISAEYGLLAEAVKFPADFSSVTFKLRPEARWHDGQPVTAEDVVWSFEKTIEHNPNQRFYYNHVAKAEVTGEREVTFTFDAPGNRELPHIMGQLQVMPKHWWEGQDAQGRKRDIGRSTLEPPLGSGPYRIKSFDPNRVVLYERVPDYWAKDLNVNVGVYNFDEIRFDEYRDTSVLLEAFKGDQYDWRTENSAKNWATGYDFPARHQGKVILQEFPDKASGIMQAFVPNLRLEKFQDPRVRRALNLAWDSRPRRHISSASTSASTAISAGRRLASPAADGRELEILEVRNKVPPKVFQPLSQPVNTPDAKRNNLREASASDGGGYELRAGQLVNARPASPSRSRLTQRSRKSVHAAFNRTGKIGTMTFRRDTPQFTNASATRFRDDRRLVGQSLSPGNEQRGYWGSQSADEQNSRNYAGIKNPAVDALIDKVIYAPNRDELVAATKALDRVLLWNHYMVPQFYSDVYRTARWDRFGHPERISEYTPGFPDTWWFDPERAQKIAIR